MMFFLKKIKAFLDSSHPVAILICHFLYWCIYDFRRLMFILVVAVPFFTIGIPDLIYSAKYCNCTEVATAIIVQSDMSEVKNDNFFKASWGRYRGTSITESSRGKILSTTYTYVYTVSNTEYHGIYVKPVSVSGVHKNGESIEIKYNKRKPFKSMERSCANRAKEMFQIGIITMAFFVGLVMWGLLAPKNLLDFKSEVE